MSKFQDDIKKFNSIYKLPVASAPTLEVGVPVAQRLADLKNILAEELNEIDAIIQMAHASSVAPISILTALTDLLGDIQVYCASEMAKFGLPLDETLEIIMQSNFSKLGADGLPIYDERGKVLKGPAYWKPEPKLQEMLISKFETTSIDQPTDDLVGIPVDIPYEHVNVTIDKNGCKIFSIDNCEMSPAEAKSTLAEVKAAFTSVKV